MNDRPHTPAPGAPGQLIGRPPNPKADRQPLSILRDPKNRVTRRLARRLYTDPGYRHQTLRELLVGLDLVYAPRLFDSLRVRAANLLGRADLRSLTDLAAISPAQIHALHGVGPETLDEILLAVVSEWAAAYLRGGDAPSKAASQRNPSSQANQRATLAQAFEELEQQPAFPTFKRRRLDEGDNRTGSAIAKELGVSHQLIHNKQTAIEKALIRRMREGNWPIRIAVDELRDRLGSVARPRELSQAFEVLDDEGEALPERLPHRRVLLLRLGGFRVSEEWVLGPDIESLTKVVLTALSNGAPSDLDAATRHLSRLGVREELQPLWIASQPDFQIIDGQVVPLSAT